MCFDSSIRIIEYFLKVGLDWHTVLIFPVRPSESVPSELPGEKWR